MEDSDSLTTDLKNEGIIVTGISTIESVDNPQTLVFVPDNTTDKQKTIIDDIMRTALVKTASRPSDNPSETEETITDEARIL